MHFIVYKTTNLLNLKFYIGSHKTENINDGYIGSGKYFWRAVEKYGKQNFRREVLADFNNAKEMFALEKELVAKEKRNSLCYNIKDGGQGGFDYINQNGLGNYKAGCLKAVKRKRELLAADPDYFKKAQRKAMEANPEWRRILTERFKINNPGRNAFTGKKHTQESKLKMSKAAIARNTTGERNSQFGTCWINNLRVAKKIKKANLQQYLDIGWIKGRKGFMKTTKGEVGESGLCRRS